MIRKLCVEDMDQVIELWLHGNWDAHRFIPRRYWESHAAEVREQLLCAEVYIYEENGRILGFAGMQKNYLAGIFVKKESRGNRIGKRLLDHVKSVHPSMTLNVYQKNQRAVSFYEREGFLVLQTETDHETGEIDYTMGWKRGKKETCQTHYEFLAKIEPVPDKGGAYVRFPYDIRKEFGKGRMKAEITFDGEPYSGNIVNMGVKNEDGSVCYIIGIRKDIREKIGKQPGDPVKVTVTVARP